MSAVLDPFVLEHAPGPLVELDPAMLRARAAFHSALASLAGITDDQLTYQWMWGGHEADLDADPGNSEWTIRRTLQHTVNSQRGYAWGSAYWLSVRDQPRPAGPQRAPENVFSALLEEEDEALGNLASIRMELDDIVDVTASRYATLTQDEMAVKAGWAGLPVTIGFRQWRWSSHIVEHTIQVEKTLDMLGRRRSEVDWLSRSVAGAYGRLEATAFGRASAGAASATFERVARELDELAQTVPAAAAAAKPGEEL